jgi:hypothetical protein
MTYRVLSPLCGILRVSSKQPDCSPSTGGRTGQAPPPVWPAKMTEVGLVSAPHPDTGSRILLSPLRFSALRSIP